MTFWIDYRGNNNAKTTLLPILDLEIGHKKVRGRKKKRNKKEN